MSPFESASKTKPQNRRISQVKYCKKYSTFNKEKNVKAMVIVISVIAANRPFRGKIRHFESGANSSKARWVLPCFLLIFERDTYCSGFVAFSTSYSKEIFLKVRQTTVYVFLGSINGHLLAFVGLNHPATSTDSTQVRCCIYVNKLADSQILS